VTSFPDKGYCAVSPRAAFFWLAEQGHTAQYGPQSSAWSWWPSCNGVCIALVQRSERTNLALMAFREALGRPGSGVSRHEAARQGEVLSLQRTQSVRDEACSWSRHICVLNDNHRALLCFDGHNAVAPTYDSLLRSWCDPRGNARSAIRSAIPTASGPLPSSCLETSLASCNFPPIKQDGHGMWEQQFP
jgi:hypothetical protein